MIEKILNYHITISTQTAITIIYSWLLVLTTWIILKEYDEWKKIK